MLMKLAIDRREDHARIPIDADEILLALHPQERIPLTADGEDVRAGLVVVRFLVRARRDFGRVRVHVAVGEEEHQVHRARTALAPAVSSIALKSGTKFVSHMF